MNPNEIVIKEESKKPALMQQTSASAVEPVELEKKIIELCNEFPTGITDQMILATVPSASASQRQSALNRLLSLGKVDLFKNPFGALLFKLKDAKVAGLSDSDNQEKVVYQIVKEANNKGIWSRDIRMKSNLVLTQVNKILKSLESKKLIKAVNAVNAPKKKVYMLSELEPDSSVTGGAWYSDQDFESEFVQVLNQQCHKFMQQKALSAKERYPDDPLAQRAASYASSKEVLSFIIELGISKITLSVQDIEAILNTLIYDGKAEKNVVGGAGVEIGQQNLYRAVPPLVPPTGLVRVPCGVCPVIKDCRLGSDISPSTCQYMKDWLSF